MATVNEENKVSTFHLESSYMYHYFIQSWIEPHEWVEVDSHYKDENSNAYVISVWVEEDEQIEDVLDRLNSH